jgi:hypothetical protein
VGLPCALGGEIIVRGYPLAMVHAEKIVTAITRGTTSTRWRDFADIYLLARHHPIDGDELSASVREVALHRGTHLAPLGQTVAGYGAIGQQRWGAWRRRQLLDDRLPANFKDVLDTVIAFADPAITGAVLTKDGTRRPAPGHEHLSETYLPVVTGVAVVGDHILRLLFSDAPQETSTSLTSSGQASWSRSPTQSTSPK